MQVDSVRYPVPNVSIEDVVRMVELGIHPRRCIVPTIKCTSETVTSKHDYIAVSATRVYAYARGLLCVYDRQGRRLQLMPFPEGINVALACTRFVGIYVGLVGPTMALVVAVFDLDTRIDHVDVSTIRVPNLYTTIVCDHVVYIFTARTGITLYDPLTRQQATIIVDDNQADARVMPTVTSYDYIHVIADGRTVILVNSATFRTIHSVVFKTYVLSAALVDHVLYALRRSPDDTSLMLTVCETARPTESDIYVVCESSKDILPAEYASKMPRSVMIKLCPAHAVKVTYDVRGRRFYCRMHTHDVIVYLDGTCQPLAPGTSVTAITPTHVYTTDYDQIVCTDRMSIHHKMALVMKAVRWRFPGHLATWLFDEFVWH